MAFVVYRFQQVVLPIKAVSCSVSARPPVKRKCSVSHTALNWEVLCGHTHGSARPCLSAKHMSPLPAEGLQAFVSIFDLRLWLRAAQ